MVVLAVSSSQKKQQSISSFFASKPPSSHTPKPKPNQAALSSSPANFKRLVNSSESTEGLPPAKRQKTPSVEDHENGDERRELYDETSALELTQNSSTYQSPRVCIGHVSDEIPPFLQSRSPVANEVIQDKAPRKAANHNSQRSSRYVFSDFPTTEDIVDDDEDVIKEKARLHRKFVKRLGHPDSIAEIKRKNKWLDDPTAEGDELADDEDAEDQEATKSKKGTATKKNGTKLTPMEKQVIDIKRKHMDTLLVVEVGYKFRFFGEDARTAAKELSIVCIPGKFRFDEHPSEAHLDRFASASIPVHRLHVHVKRLVSAGHKVGVVRQLETAALKAAGDNRNSPFVRKLTNVYTKGTYIDDVEGLEGAVSGSSGSAPATGHLLCVTETNAKGWGTDEKVQVGIVAVQPTTGDIVYDDFEDGFMRSELETRLLHIAPCEFLIVGTLSKATEKLVHHLSASKTTVFGDKARVEYVEKPKTMAAHSYSHISNFYADKLKSEEDRSSNVLDKVHKLSEHVTICLSAMITHLSEYGLEHVFDLTKNFQAFSARSHMLLNGNTLTSLEIYRNQTDYSEKGSLFWVLDQTQTRFGQRLLRKWVGRPLLDRQILQDRIDAVEEIKSTERAPNAEKIRRVLSKIKMDLEKGLIRIYYQKCTRPELLNVLQTLQRIGSEYAHVRSVADAGFESKMINEAIAVLPLILDDIVAILDKINTEAAQKDDKYSFLREEHETEKITEQRIGITSVEHDLNQHRKVAAIKLRKNNVEYVTVAGIDYLIEVENQHVKNVPASWVKISGTKKFSRFHTPEVIRLIRERDQHKEALAAACDESFMALLTDISSNYQPIRDCIQSLAILDCLLSLAEVANRPNYCKPTFTDDTRLSVVGGRHPMVEHLLLDAYVPNDVDLSSSGTRALLITGPNMGGKSSYVRQVALISIMAQCGSYVPAQSAELGMLDAVFTRMGAFDNMMSGESTFMVELSETSDILKQASPRSLIILDELGRGTSTHDGVAIAHAVLHHIVRETKSLLLFITHYQSLSTVANAFENNELRNMHMRFTESEIADDDQDITFLYELGEGVAHRSYGLNVARLANVPKSVIEVAGVMSKQLERDIQRALLESLTENLKSAMDTGENVETLVERIEQL